MLFLFSNRNGPLRDGAAFMQTKNRSLHPGLSDFYLIAQQNPTHNLLGGLGPNSQFDNVDCQLEDGEVVIIIGHGGNDNGLYDEAGANVTAAAIRLLTRIGEQNPNGNYIFFLAACGGALRQAGATNSLLNTLVSSVPRVAQQLLDGTIECWGYTATAGLVVLNQGLPADRRGTHIYGVLPDQEGVDQHCGYDRRITTRTRRLSNGQYVTIYFSPALYPLAEVIAWANVGYEPDMEEKFPRLYETVELTS